MKILCFRSVLTLGLAINWITFCDSKRRVSQEEWHQYRLGGMAMATDVNQWPMNTGQDIQAQMDNAGAVDPSLETNIQSVDVGRDKLVLVNDQGSIKMVRASQLPTMTKQSATTTTPQPTVIQMPLDQFYAKESNTNSPKDSVQYITQNYGAGHRVAGLPIAFATSSKSEDRPNVIYQKFEDNPCRVASDTPPIYIPAPQVETVSPSRSDRKMVRIIIEMPESMTRNIDEASRYAATQVKRLKHTDEKSDANRSPRPNRKIKKNIHEIIRKVVQMEEDSGDSRDSEDSDSAHSGMSTTEDEMTTESNTKQENDLIIANNEENPENSEHNKYVLVRKKTKLRRRGDYKRADNDLRSYNKYKKVIKVFGS